MKTKYITIVTLLLCLFVTAPDINAKGGKFFKWLGKNLGSAAAGWVDKTVEKNLSSEEQRGTWSEMNRDFRSNMGIDDSYANAGRNWAEGKKADALIDLAEGVSSNAGLNNAGVQSAFDFARAQNDYKKDIKSGMSQEEALKRRNEKLVQAGLNLYDEYIVSDAEKEKVRRYEQNQQYKAEKAWESKYVSDIYHELLKRGYSSHEAYMYINIINKDSTGLLQSLSYNIPIDKNAGKEEQRADSIDYLTSRLIYDEGVQSKIEELLDNLNIRDRGIGNGNDYSSNDNSLFGTPAYIPEPNEKDIVETPRETSPQPVVNERVNAAKAISRTVLNNYSINDVNLSDAQKAELDQVADKMTKFDDIQIDILGHTCNLGTQEVNQNIGERRANAAKKYLMSKGILENRIQVKSRGFSEPIADNDNEEHRMQNRRVTFHVK